MKKLLFSTLTLGVLTYSINTFSEILYLRKSLREYMRIDIESEKTTYRDIKKQVESKLPDNCILTKIGLDNQKNCLVNFEKETFDQLVSKEFIDYLRTGVAPYIFFKCYDSVFDIPDELCTESKLQKKIRLRWMSSVLRAKPKLSAEALIAAAAKLDIESRIKQLTSFAREMQTEGVKDVILDNLAMYGLEDQAMLLEARIRELQK